MTYTNAKVNRIIGCGFQNPYLAWEVRGYINGLWFNVPFHTQAQAQEWLDQHTATVPA